MEKIIIEVLSRKKQLLERVLCHAFPVTIGRAYTNDVIVSDPYVAENQLVLTKIDDQWQVENVDPVNTLCVNHVPQKALTFTVQSGHEISIGETTFRLLAATHQVAATKKIPPLQDARMQLGAITLAWLSVGGTLGYFAWLIFLATTKVTPWAKILAQALPTMAIPIAWAMFWAAIGRILIAAPNFHAHLFRSALVAVAASWAYSLSEYVAYLLNSELLSKVGFYLSAGSLAVFLLQSNLYLATDFSKRKRLALACVSIGGLILLVEFFNLARKAEFQTWTSFNTTLKPPYLKILPNKSADQFFAETEPLFQKLDQMLVQEEK
jgi:hypothetical protein